MKNEIIITIIIIIIVVVVVNRLAPQEGLCCMEWVR
jgi:hypothetical protein